ncbi:hypothetical protein [Youngiibacter fragilis]|uniref:Uncharacterized protein n=1 Tax=Youngiibacter fragilis 232.1 TaxID=994573 RepID=V7I841_9CLOT|nr:hypothetical protein [Youngiibacter fragilis]ETA81446.1 hypothetical protein T472_0206475 [Youngiibacter fragilis 232.1]
MKLSYDFSGYKPPVLDENKLMETVYLRQLAKRTLLLTIASLFSNICLVLLAFVIAQYSLAAGMACLVLLGASLAGSGIIAAVFAKRYPMNLRSIFEA